MLKQSKVFEEFNRISKGTYSVICGEIHYTTLLLPSHHPLKTGR